MQNCAGAIKAKVLAVINHPEIFAKKSLLLVSLCSGGLPVCQKLKFYSLKVCMTNNMTCGVLVQLISGTSEKYFQNNAVG